MTASAAAAACRCCRCRCCCCCAAACRSAERSERCYGQRAHSRARGRFGGREQHIHPYRPTLRAPHGHSALHCARTHQAPRLCVGWARRARGGEAYSPSHVLAASALSLARFACARPRDARYDCIAFVVFGAFRLRRAHARRAFIPLTNARASTRRARRHT